MAKAKQRERGAADAGKRDAKTAKKKESTTEEKIKEAARKLFTQKGFAATRTRDIAEEAGINLALLNYYFRSKQKLFDLVMMENFRNFLGHIKVNFKDASLPMAEKIEKIVAAYIDFLTQFPDLPMFILNEIRGNPSKIAARINEEIAPARSEFFRDLAAANAAGKIALTPFQFVANLVGLTVFPFVARPVLQRLLNVTNEQFKANMQERKQLVPLWLKMMMTPQDKKQTKP
jgi:AcrR family transcriptional regulator